MISNNYNIENMLAFICLVACVFAIIVAKMFNMNIDNDDNMGCLLWIGIAFGIFLAVQIMKSCN